MESLQQSKLYADKPKVKEYCEKVWLNCSEQWSHAFCVQQAVNTINTNNGIKVQNKVSQVQLSARINQQISIQHHSNHRGVICAKFHQHYIETNLQVSSAYRQFNRYIPDYLHNRPTHFVKHCLKSKFVASEYDQSDIPKNFGKGEFLVRSCSISNRLFAVKLSKQALLRGFQIL